MKIIKLKLTQKYIVYLTHKLGGNMEQAKKLWALVLAHKKISIAVAVVVVLIIIAQ